MVVLLSGDWGWSQQFSPVMHKVHQRLRFVRQNLRGARYKYRKTIYQCLVRSQLEYCATVWDPTLKKDINSLEQVHRRAARWACGGGQCHHTFQEAGLERVGGLPAAPTSDPYIQNTSVYLESADQHVAPGLRAQNFLFNTKCIMKFYRSLYVSIKITMTYRIRLDFQNQHK